MESRFRDKKNVVIARRGIAISSIEVIKSHIIKVNINEMEDLFQNYSFAYRTIFVMVFVFKNKDKWENFIILKHI